MFSICSIFNTFYTLWKPKYWCTSHINILTLTWLNMRYGLKDIHIPHSWRKAWGYGIYEVRTTYCCPDHRLAVSIWENSTSRPYLGNHDHENMKWSNNKKNLNNLVAIFHLTTLLHLSLPWNATLNSKETRETTT
jgi:hypothetical protein